ncbi:putative ferric-chelate reductase 1 isoform X1 [Mercenaria mercenaria]|uniref:putative ferric-chelate reductase 1 isoform X1 n=1 Tax=Mercenaria mercenaria TaxID=6596 RepID=UPI00234F1066|nr:putative ferric-chelate reductase 1 isoform X1 [Mercenaria mercenaria]
MAKIIAKHGIFIINLLHLIWNINEVYGFPNGAPWDTCLTMFPKHGRQRQMTPCPFQMTPNTTRYSPSESIHLIVSARTSGDTLKGIQIRARPKSGDTERIVGQFTDWPANKTHALDCLGGEKNMITHSNNLPVSSMHLIWTAPNISVGDIEFVISYVQDFTRFWVDEVVELTATELISEPQTEQLSPTFEIIDWSECGKSKGCFLYPRTCSGHDCYTAVTYKTVNNSVEFEMFGSQEGYVSVGFSDDIVMGHDETITCTSDESGCAIQRGYNHEELYNERQFKHGLFDIQGTYKDGRLYCRFKRPLSMFVYIGEGHKLRKHYDLSDNYYLMLAWGPIYKGTEVIGIHVQLPLISSRKVSFQENEIIRGSSLPLTKQIHGSLMLIGWMWLIGIATIVARHFKNGFNNRIVCGSKVWFQIHRPLAIITWLLTVASFVLIFVVVGKLTENAEIHSYLGITVMSASTLQVVMGIVRPKPDSKIRAIFIWGHWFLGKSTIIIAVVTFFFAFNNDMIPQPQTYFANIVLGVFVGQQVLWEVWFEINKNWQLKKASEKYELKDMSKTGGQSGGKKLHDDYVNPSTSPSTPDKALVLYTLCIMIISAAALASVFLF